MPIWSEMGKLEQGRSIHRRDTAYSNGENKASHACFYARRRIIKVPSHMLDILPCMLSEVLRPL